MVEISVNYYHSTLWLEKLADTALFLGFPLMLNRSSAKEELKWKCTWNSAYYTYETPVISGQRRSHKYNFAVFNACHLSSEGSRISRAVMGQRRAAWTRSSGKNSTWRLPFILQKVGPDYPLTLPKENLGILGHFLRMCGKLMWRLYLYPRPVPSRYLIFALDPASGPKQLVFNEETRLALFNHFFALK